MFRRLLGRTPEQSGTCFREVNLGGLHERDSERRH